MKIDNKRVFEIYEANAHLDKQEKADICNREFGTNYDESSFRKRYAVYRDALDRQIDNLEDEALERIVAKEWNIKKEQRKLAIAKMQLNKDTNTKAFGELVQEAVEQLEFPVYDFTALPEPKGSLYRRVPVRPGEFYIFTHADLHYDGTFDLKTHFQKMYDIIVAKNVPKVYIFGLGDEIEGLLRVSAAMDARLGAVEQMKEYAVHYLNFLQRLSQTTQLIVYQVTSSNHTQTRVLSTGRNELEKEDLLQLLDVILQVGLAENPNAEYVSGEEIYTTIGNFKFYIEHGHLIRKASAYIEKKQADLGITIDYHYSGHIHHYLNETLHARSGFDCDYTVAPSCKPTQSTYEKNLMLSANPAVLWEVFDIGGRVSTEKILL
jgi:hypothetical protein